MQCNRTHCMVCYGDNDDIKPVWPSWAVDALFRGARHIQNVWYAIHYILNAYCLISKYIFKSSNHNIHESWKEHMGVLKSRP
jgi:hypothetical protein